MTLTKAKKRKRAERAEPGVLIPLPKAYQIHFYGQAPIGIAVALMLIAVAAIAWMLLTRHFQLIVIGIAVIACCGLVLLDFAKLKWRYCFTRDKVELFGTEGGSLFGDRVLADWREDRLLSMEDTDWNGRPAIRLSMLRKGESAPRFLVLAFYAQHKDIVENKVKPLLGTHLPATGGAEVGSILP
jgi:hypothetical protein